EVGALVVATALTAVLVEVTPARAALDEGPVVETAALGEGAVEVRVEDPTVGRAALELVLTDAAGDRLDVAAGDISVDLALPEADIGPITRAPDGVSPGRWRIDG